MLPAFARLQVPLVSDLPQLTEAYRLTKLAVASYGDAQRGEGVVGLLPREVERDRK